MKVSTCCSLSLIRILHLFMHVAMIFILCPLIVKSYFLLTVLRQSTSTCNCFTVSILVNGVICLLALSLNAVQEFFGCTMIYYCEWISSISPSFWRGCLTTSAVMSCSIVLVRYGWRPLISSASARSLPVSASSFAVDNHYTSVRLPGWSLFRVDFEKLGLFFFTVCTSHIVSYRGLHQAH